MEDIVSKKPTIKLNFEFNLHRIEEMSRTDLTEFTIEWTKGKKKTNRGQIFVDEISGGKAEINRKFFVRASMQQLGKNKFESKQLTLVLREKKRKLGKVAVYLNEIVENYTSGVKTISITKNNQNILHYEVNVEVLFVGKHQVKITDYPSENTFKYAGNFYEIESNVAKLKNTDWSSNESTLQSKSHSNNKLSIKSAYFGESNNHNRDHHKKPSKFLSLNSNSTAKMINDKKSFGSDVAFTDSKDTVEISNSGTLGNWISPDDTQKSTIIKTVKNNPDNTKASKFTLLDSSELSASESAKNRFDQLKKRFESQNSKDKSDGVSLKTSTSQIMPHPLKYPSFNSKSLETAASTNNVLASSDPKSLETTASTSDTQTSSIVKPSETAASTNDTQTSYIVKSPETAADSDILSLQKKSKSSNVQNFDKHVLLPSKKVMELDDKEKNRAVFESKLDIINSRIQDVCAKLDSVQKEKCAVSGRRHELAVQIENNRARFKQIDKQLENTEMSLGLVKLEKSELKNTASLTSEYKSGLEILKNCLNFLYKCMTEAKSGRDYQDLIQSVEQQTRSRPYVNLNSHEELLSVHKMITQCETVFVDLLKAELERSVERANQLNDALSTIKMLEQNRIELESQILKLNNESLELVHKLSEFERSLDVKNAANVETYRDQINSEINRAVSETTELSSAKSRSKNHKANKRSSKPKDADVISGLQASLAMSEMVVEKKKRKVAKLKSQLEFEKKKTQAEIESLEKQNVIKEKMATLEAEKLQVEHELKLMRNTVSEIEFKERSKHEDLQQKLTHLMNFITALGIDSELLFDQTNANLIKDRIDSLARELKEVLKIEQTVYQIKSLTRAEELSPQLFDLLEWIKLGGYFDQPPSKFLERVTQSIGNRACLSESIKNLLAWMGQIGLMRNYVMEYYGEGKENLEFEKPTKNPAVNIFIFGIEDVTLKIYSQLLEIIYSELEGKCEPAIFEMNLASMDQLQATIKKIHECANQLGLHTDVTKQVLFQVFHYIDCAIFNALVKPQSLKCSSVHSIDVKLRLCEFVDFVNKTVPEVELEVANFVYTNEAINLLILDKSTFTEKDLELFVHLNYRQIFGLMKNLSINEDASVLNKYQDFYLLMKQKSHNTDEPLLLTVKNF